MKITDCDKITAVHRDGTNLRVRPQEIDEMNEIFERRLPYIVLVLSFVFPACAYKAPGLAGGEKVSLLHKAVRTDNTARVKDLIETGAHINEADATGMTPLGIAVERQNLERR